MQCTADGHVPLLEKIASHATTQPGPNAASPSQIDFTSPLTVEALWLNKVCAEIKDDAVSPKLDASLTMDLRVTHPPAPQGTPLEFEMDAWADRMLDSLHVQGTATGTGRNLDATGKVYLRGLHAKPLAGYLVPLGLKPVADSIGMEADATLKARLLSPSSAIAATCAINNVCMTADDLDFATLASITIDAAEVDPRSMKMASIVLDRGKFVAGRDVRCRTRHCGIRVRAPQPRRNPPQHPRCRSRFRSRR